MSDYLSDALGDGGLFASHFPSYEKREGQVALARKVDEAMWDGRHLLGKGPCGSGKGQAHCLPAVWRAHRREERVNHRDRKHRPGGAAVLDRRLAEKGYGRKLLRSLPPSLATPRLEGISRFLKEAARARAS